MDVAVKTFRRAMERAYAVGLPEAQGVADEILAVLSDEARLDAIIAQKPPVKGQQYSVKILDVVPEDTARCALKLAKPRVPPGIGVFLVSRYDHEHGRAAEVWAFPEDQTWFKYES